MFHICENLRQVDKKSILQIAEKYFERNIYRNLVTNIQEILLLLRKKYMYTNSEANVHIMHRDAFIYTHVLQRQLSKNSGKGNGF